MLEMEPWLLEGSWALFKRLDAPTDNEISKAVKVDENTICTATLKVPKRKQAKEKATIRKPRNTAKR